MMKLLRREIIHRATVTRTTSGNRIPRRFVQQNCRARLGYPDPIGIGELPVHVNLVPLRVHHITERGDAPVHGHTPAADERIRPTA
jgi:hypothetical protein